MMKRRYPLFSGLLVIAAMAIALVVRANPNSFTIENADEAATLSLVSSIPLTSLIDTVQPRVIMEFSDANQKHLLAAPPVDLTTYFNQVMQRILLQYADGNRLFDLSYPNTLIGDTTPPQEVSAPEVIPSGANSVKIRWQTNEFSRGTIEYGAQSGQYSHSVSESLYARDHELTLTGLAGEGETYYRIIHTDPAGNSSRGPERSFAIGADGQKLFLPLTLDR